MERRLHPIDLCFELRIITHLRARLCLCVVEQTPFFFFCFCFFFFFLLFFTLFGIASCLLAIFRIAFCIMPLIPSCFFASVLIYGNQEIE